MVPFLVQGELLLGPEELFAVPAVVLLDLAAVEVSVGAQRLISLEAFSTLADKWRLGVSLDVREATTDFYIRVDTLATGFGATSVLYLPYTDGLNIINSLWINRTKCSVIYKKSMIFLAIIFFLLKYTTIVIN